MAEIVVSALLTVVFEKLTSAVLTKVGRSKKVHSDLEEWKRSLNQIRRLLNDASQKEITDESVKDWLNRLHHLAYDIDDILDSLATDHAMHPELTQDEPAAEEGIIRKVRKLIPTCCTSSSSNNDTEMDGKLNEITTKLQQLYDEKEKLGLTVKDGRSKDKNRSYQTSLFDPASIVGREDEKQVLLQELLGDEPGVNQNKFSIVPIVGMGGIGKTTLARLLYNEPKVKEHFDIKAWVCVSDEESDSFDSFYISKLIFDSVATEKKTFENPDKLQEALKDQLNGKRFLLVLDDLWSEKIQDWEILVGPFHVVAPGSKIIITTRKENLLQQLGYNNSYHLNKLSDNDALSLFAKHALGADNFDSHQTLRPYGEGIVKNCDGLPLALKTLGSLLRTKTDEEKWKEVLESKIWTLKDEGGILPALRLSYQELSACLKQLFAYTCLFPKDCEFEKEDLILLWMAEGFLHGTTKKSMEVSGEECFDELLSRSFFQRLPSDESVFMMHDLMHDLATSVAGEFFLRLDIEMKKDIMKERYRHMSFVREEFLACKKFEAFERPNSLRSFLAVPVVARNNWWESFYLSNKVLDDLLPRLPLLRVLSLSRLTIDEVPESVGDLKHLRYLNLSETRITHLPENVCDLYNLQTLIVFGCHKLSKLPESFSKLKKLRHLDIRDTPLLENMPLGIGQMKNLQTLSKIIIGGVDEFAISGFKNLKNLRRRVSIHGLDKLQNPVQAREAKLFQMKLSELVVEWSDAFDGSRKKILEREVLDVLKPHRDNFQKLEILSYGGTEFPKWVGDPSIRWLTVVRMYNCRNCVFLPPLGQLPSLKKLSIESMDGVKKVGPELLGTGPAAFPSLENLEFRNMEGWEVWSADITGFVDGAFPCLKELTIADCRNMAGWEVWSANADVAVFPCLEELRVDSCPKLVKVSLEALPSLKTLDVQNCGDVLLKSLVGVASSSVTKLWIGGISGLSDEVWGGVVQYLGALEELRIEYCNEIRYMWESESEACKVLVNLNRLSIRWCDNLERFGGGGEKEEEEGSNLFLTSLRMLQIYHCKNLKHLICPNSIEELKIFSCDNLKHLICPNSIEELSINFCSSITSVFFPTIERGGGRGWQKLKSLVIENCNCEVLEKELEKQVLIINNTNMPIPMLQFLRIDGWRNLKSIMELNCFIQLTRLAITECPVIESFPVLQNLTLLKHLEIIFCSSMDAPPSPSDGDGDGGGGVWPPNLHSLKIGELKKLISKWGPQDFPTSLVDLTLYGGSEEEDDVSGGSQLSHILPSSLTKLELWFFEKMETISEGLQHLTSLQHLSIGYCPNLKDLPETLLPSLLSLVINVCSEDLKEKTCRSGSYWPRISHIPKVYISSRSWGCSNSSITLAVDCFLVICSYPFALQHYGVDIGRKKKAVPSATKKEGEEVEGATEEAKKSNHVARKLEKRQEERKLDSHVEEQFSSGRLLAAISSRPGQCGHADGYILEGKELEFYMKKLQKKKGKGAAA